MYDSRQLRIRVGDLLIYRFDVGMLVVSLFFRKPTATLIAGLRGNETQTRRERFIDVGSLV